MEQTSRRDQVVDAVTDISAMREQGRRATRSPAASNTSPRWSSRSPAAVRDTAHTAQRLRAWPSTRGTKSPLHPSAAPPRSQRRQQAAQSQQQRASSSWRPWRGHHDHVLAGLQHEFVGCGLNTRSPPRRTASSIVVGLRRRRASRARGSKRSWHQHLEPQLVLSQHLVEEGHHVGADHARGDPHSAGSR